MAYPQAFRPKEPGRMVGPKWDLSRPDFGFRLSNLRRD